MRKYRTNKGAKARILLPVISHLTYKPHLLTGKLIQVLHLLTLGELVRL